MWVWFLVRELRSLHAAGQIMPKPQLLSPHVLCQHITTREKPATKIPHTANKTWPCQTNTYLKKERKRKRKNTGFLWITCFGPNPVLGAFNFYKSSRRETRWSPFFKGERIESWRVNTHSPPPPGRQGRACVVWISSQGRPGAPNQPLLWPFTAAHQNQFLQNWPVPTGKLMGPSS